jgi:hypothetical protein
MSDSTPYNPLDKKNLGASVAEALLGRKPRPLGELRSHLELTQPPAHTHFYAEQKRGGYRVEPG